MQSFCESWGEKKLPRLPPSQLLYREKKWDLRPYTIKAFLILLFSLYGLTWINVGCWVFASFLSRLIGGSGQIADLLVEADRKYRKPPQEPLKVQFATAAYRRLQAKLRTFELMRSKKDCQFKALEKQENQNYLQSKLQPDFDRLYIRITIDGINYAAQIDVRFNLYRNSR